MSVKDVSRKGFTLQEKSSLLEDFSPISLSIALKAFFSTYSDIRYRFADMKLLHTSEDDSRLRYRRAHSHKYCESSAETILHFQHFSELFLKDILRKKHPLLALNIDITRNVSLFHDLLYNPNHTYDDARLNTVEFGQSLDRVIQLLRDNKLDNSLYGFIFDFEEMLKELNYLRNRVWHRGVFILEYASLDQFIGKYVFPFIRKVMELPTNTNRRNVTWKYRMPACKVDPFDGIMNLLSAPYNDQIMGKIAFLKEIARATYNNPADQQLIDSERKSIVKRAEAHAKNDYYEVRICPACGHNTLVVEEDSYEEGPIYAESVNCTLCTFELTKEVKCNPRDIGIEMDDFWY